MSSTFNELLRSTPTSVRFVDFDTPSDIDLRRGCVDVLFANTIGINEDSADWLPNDDPPDENERLAWIWFVRPDLADELLANAVGDLRMLIQCYGDGQMDDWWAHMTGR